MRCRVRPLAATFAGVFLLCLLAAMQLRAQTLGQQVSPQPYGSSGASPQAPAQTNQQPLPYSGAGLGSMTAGTMQQLSTGVDIPQASIVSQISLGDLVDVLVFDTPELSGRFRVNTQGNIILPLVGPLHMDGLTIPEGADAVARAYKDALVLLHPQVQIFITEFATRGVTMSGEVRAPGIYPLTGPRNLTDMLALAGGLNDSASKTVSIVHRGDPNKITTVTLHVGAQTPASVMAANMQVGPGDTIFVARSGIVYVVGDLNRPGGYQVEHNNRLTLLDAVALAGGPTQTSKLWDARLIRRTDTGREELKIDLKKILYGGGPDMLMTDGDILYVPISQRKTYTLRAIDAVVGAATNYLTFKAAQF